MIRCRGSFLLLRRASIVSVNPGLWSPVTGRVEGKLSLEKSAYKEIREETGLRRGGLRLVKKGGRYTLRIKQGVEASVQTFLFETKVRSIKLNWEHVKYRWVKPAQIVRFQLIPKFDLTLKALDLI